MALPTEAELLAQVNALKNYTSLFINGRLSEEARAVISGSSGSSGGGGTPIDTTPLLTKIKTANDYGLTLNSLDAGTVTERLSSVVYASQSVGYKITDTFTYTASAPYVLQSTSRAIAAYP